MLKDTEIPAADASISWPRTISGAVIIMVSPELSKNGTSGMKEKGKYWTNASESELSTLWFRLKKEGPSTYHTLLNTNFDDDLYDGDASDPLVSMAGTLRIWFYDVPTPTKIYDGKVIPDYGYYSDLCADMMIFASKYLRADGLGLTYSEAISEELKGQS